MRRAIYCAALAGAGFFMPGCPDGGGPDSLRVTPEALHLEVGQRGTLRAESSAAGDRVTWTSSANGVASVASSGEVTALAVGTAQIRAVSSRTELEDTATVTVTENLPPALTLSAPEPAATTAGPVTLTLTYDGATAITLAEADISLTATGTAAAGTVTFAGEGNTTRTITLDALTGDGTLSISIAAGTATDTEGNTAPGAGPSEVVTVDNTAPGLEISGPSAAATSTGPVDYQVSYTGADAITLATSDVLVNGTGTAAATLADVATTSESERTVSFANINGDGTLGISIAQGTATDQAGNAAPAAGPSAEVVVDNTPPTATIGAPYPATTNDGPVSFRVTYDGASAITLAEADIDINTTGAVVAVFDTIEVTSDTVRTVRFSMVAGDGTLGIALRAGTAVDEAGNEAPATDPGPTVTVDNTAPQVVIGPPSTASTSAGPVVYRVTYTGADEVTLDRDNVTLNTTGTAAAYISEVADVGEGRYDITLGTVIGNGTLGISLPAGTATDDAGNAAPAAGPSDTLNVSNAGPTLLIGRPTTANTFGDPVSYTITYADAATITLAPADITLVSDDGVTATASVTGSGTTQRTVTLSSFSGLGDAAITIAANTAQDAGANPAPAAGPGEGFRVNPLLEPGSGFTGPTPQPDPIGAPGAPGIDAKAIARWDVVPYQTFDGYFEIGVVAFHINDIDRVEFSVEGGPWTAVREMTLNPLTDVVEYWVGLDARDFEDGPIEVRAVAYPKVGIPRVLGGEDLGFHNGEHSIVLFTNALQSFTTEEVYVSLNATPGSGALGTLTSPLASLTEAYELILNKTSGQKEYTIVLLDAGTYFDKFQDSGFGALINERWITIRPAQGLTREEVIISRPEWSMIRNHVARVRWENVTFDFDKIEQYYAEGLFVWFDRCRWYSSLGWLNRMIRLPNARGNYYATECLSYDLLYGFTNSSLVRDSRVEISGDALQNSKLVLNCEVVHIDGSATLHHTDLYQMWGETDNTIIYGLHASDIKDTQSIFLQPTFETDINLPRLALTNSAFINMNIQNTFSNADLELAGGPPFSQLQSKNSHLLFRNVKLPMQRFEFRTDWVPNSGNNQWFEVKNVVFNQVEFHPATWDIYSIETNWPVGVQFIDCYRAGGTP